MAGKPKMPAPQPTVRMPMPDDARNKEAKKAAQNRLMQSKGRESTNLTENEDTFKLGY